jgi:hypothetical protein
VQLYPGNVILRGNGPRARLVLWRFRQIPATREAQLIVGLRKLYDERLETAQVRLFRVP